MKVLVTGAFGFVGAALCRHLADDGHEVFALARGADRDPPDTRVRVVRGDVTSADDVDAAVTDMHAVFHLAAVISYSSSDRAKMFHVNVGGTRLVALACIKHGCRMIHCSSMASCGFNWRASDAVRNEQSTYNLAGYALGYCESKLASERVVLELHKEKDLDVVIVNPCNVYGSGDATKSSRQTQVKVARGRMPFYPQGGVNVVHVDDVCNGVVLAWRKGASGQRYLLGGDNITIKAMFEVIASTAGATPPRWPLFVFLQLALGRLGLVPLEKVVPANMFCWFSSAKAESELGYRHRPAAEALRESTRWMMANSPNDASHGKSAQVVTAAVVLLAVACAIYFN